ncbi:hypothetical protein [Roseovarius rhodophyticola]|uniref:Uncharacterized protein n=1 Tax=Roseovarius rhodophyticola TaxID=3080827 RepID=A0ABZ2THV6_9RHOB
MRALSLLTLAWLLLGVVSPAHAQTPEVTANRSDVIRLLGEIPNFTVIRQEYEALGYSGEKLDLAVEQAGLLYRDPVLAGYLADRLIAAYQSPESVDRNSGGLVIGLIRRGLGHLSTRELRYYYRVEQIMLQSLPERTCGRAVRDRLPPEKFSELITRLAAGFNVASLREYYRVQAKAARFGATRDPVLLSPAKSVEVENRVNGRLSEKIAESENARALRSAIGNLERAGNRQACQIGRLFMETVMELEGRALRETLIYMSLP